MPAEYSAQTKQRVRNAFEKLGGVDVLNNDIAAESGYDKSVSGTVMRDLAEAGEVTRRRFSTGTRGQRPFAYTAVQDGVRAAKVDVELPQEVESPAEPDELVEATSDGVAFQYRGRTSRAIVAALASKNVGDQFTKRAIMNQVARLKNPPTHTAVDQFLYRLRDAGYIERSGNVRVCASGERLPYWAILKPVRSLNTTSTDTVVATPVPVAAPEPEAAQTPVVSVLGTLADVQNHAANCDALRESIRDSQAQLNTIESELRAVRDYLNGLDL